MAGNLIDITEDIDTVLTKVKLVARKNSIIVKTNQQKIELALNLLDDCMNFLTSEQFEKITELKK